MYFVLFAGVLVQAKQRLLDVDVDFFAEWFEYRGVQTVEDCVQDEVEEFAVSDEAPPPRT